MPPKAKTKTEPDAVLDALKDVTAQLKRMEKKVDKLELRLAELREHQEHMRKNQVTLYGRLLVTRKNLIELFNGERPSMTRNEAKELGSGRHPLLAERAGSKRKTH
ncbi:MAG: hypothetical protein IT567_01720 [Alphaproteobacteria bacterium]|nr:hypothetical protein [Alphaproteobacteria bacterium]